MSLLRVPRRPRGLLTASLLAASALVVGAGPAAAATFVSTFEDRKGDGGRAARDIAAGRVAFNRRTGALSATVRMHADFADDAAGYVLVAVLGLEGGKCKGVLVSFLVSSWDPALPIVSYGRPEADRVRRTGTGAIEGDTLKMRFKAKALSGRTPGCAFAAVMTPEETPKLIDRTPLNTGFDERSSAQG